MIGIIGALEGEIEILKGAMQGTATIHAGCFTFSTGSLVGKDIALLRCGVGKVQAAVGTATLIERFHPALVISTGCAGGVNPANTTPIKVGDVVIATQLVYNDVDATVFGYAPGQLPGQASPYFPTDATISAALTSAVADARNAEELPADFAAVRGVIASGDSFMTDTAKILALLANFADMRAVEMESAAIAHVCALYSVPCGVLRCISDVVGVNTPADSDDNLALTARHTSAIVERFLQHWPTP
jgi:adenosylhomocysteine nucleosidase